MKKLEIIEACSDLGVTVDGASIGPKVLEKNLISNKIHEIKIENYIKDKSEKNKEKNLKYVNEFNLKLYNKVKEVIEDDSFALTIGGDHSIAIASSLASISVNKNLGMIWIDSHGDFNTFDTTKTGNIHGLPLAAITGYEKRKLVDFHKENFYDPKNTVIVGARDIDEWEMPNLIDAGVTIFTTEDIKKYGADYVIKKAIEIASKNVYGIHVSFDLDVIDPIIAPGVSVKAKDGIDLNDVDQIVKELIKNKEIIKSMDLVEFNPLNDIDKKTENIAIDILNKFFLL